MKEMCRSGRHVRTAENHPMNGRGHRACHLCEIERTATPEARQAILDWQRAQQDRTVRSATSKGRPWDAEDDAMILKFRNAGVTQTEMAMILGRTFQGIRKRVGQLISS
jgi:hypothetical protein